MIRLSIRELHMKTGEWVRKASESGSIVVMDRGKPVAKLVPFTMEDEGTPFSKRKLLKEFAKLPKIEGDSGIYISEDRDRA